MCLLDEYKNMYNSELEHSDRLNNKIGNSITFLTIEGTALIFIWSKYFSEPINTVYLLLCFLSLMSYIVTIVFFYRAYSGYRYAYFPVSDMQQKISQTMKACKDIDDGDKVAKEHISYMFEYAYITCAIINSKENCKKVARHKLFMTFVIISLFLIAITYAFSMVFIDNTHLLKGG